MHRSLVITVIADDKPGIIRTVSTVLREHNGNWHKSSMSHLAGQFAGILQCDMPTANIDQCTQALEALSEDGIRVLVNTGMIDTIPGDLREYSLELVGNDRAGIVADITRILAEYQVNVHSLETLVEGASMAGGDLFRAYARVHLHETTDVADLTLALEDIADDLMVDIVFENGVV